jgi:hypothetical protein
MKEILVEDIFWCIVMLQHLGIKSCNLKLRTAKDYSENMNNIVCNRGHNYWVLIGLQHSAFSVLKAQLLARTVFIFLNYFVFYITNK